MRIQPRTVITAIFWTVVSSIAAGLIWFNVWAYSYSQAHTRHCETVLGRGAVWDGGNRCNPPPVVVP